MLENIEEANKSKKGNPEKLETKQDEKNKTTKKQHNKCWTQPCTNNVEQTTPSNKQQKANMNRTNRFYVDKTT